ncbi:hypothetical protein JZX87_23980 [Agrobacterium sp. Ap1]|uniref:Pycsar system effector family protein n=1 Tax=Agrobacterium sp. Ap1 TaxID=2815337 RepID=UPI000FB04EB8|nr:Pycsar system effector family protein [Agrobacterium sp. Ap1]MBO0144219.1 hypothetical protein [Agrobacterium sp. Ap1]
MDDAKKNYPNFHDAYLRQYIQQADTKGSWLFAANSAIIIWMIGNVELRSIIVSPELTIFQLIAVFSCFSLVASCGFVFDAIRPRSLFTHETGIVYFAHVDNFENFHEFLTTVEKSSDEDIFRARLRAQFAMSKVCATKYRRLAVASLLSVISFLFVVMIYGWMTLR